MVVRYLEAAGQLTPEFALESKGIIEAGYQKLLSFEVNGGGFALWQNGGYQADLTAYGLMQFVEMAKIIPVDPKVIERARARLEGDAIRAARKPAQSAFILWALLESGTPASRLSQPLSELRRRAPQAKSSYTRALAMRALLAADPEDRTALAMLRDFAEQAIEGDQGAHWKNPSGGYMLSHGRSSHIEQTALIVGALLETGIEAELAQSATDWLIRQRNPRGFWGTTYSTVRTLDVLLASALSGPAAKGESVAVAVKVDGQDAGTLEIPADATDVVASHELTRFLRGGHQRVQLEVAGSTRMTCALVWRAYMPWDRDEAKPASPLAFALSYDRLELRSGELTNVTARVQYRGERTSSMLIVDVGLAPGFRIDRPSLDRLVRTTQVQRYELKGRKLSLYVDSLRPGADLRLPFRLRAGTPIRAQTPPSEVWAYYDTDQRAASQPQLLTVR